MGLLDLVAYNYRYIWPRMSRLLTRVEAAAIHSHPTIQLSSFELQ